MAALLATFLRAPARRKALALEAAAELLRARLATLLPPRLYLREFGAAAPAAAAAEGAAPPLALEIGRMVEAVAARLPLGARCLQQAIATARMLRRRGVHPVIIFGVRRDPARRRDPASGGPAHAWVSVGGEVVAGNYRLDEFLPVARLG